MPKKTDLPSSTPPELLALISKLGTKVAVVRALGTSKDYFNRILREGKTPPAWADKIDKLLKGESITPEVIVQRPEVQFKPWDGTKRNVTVVLRGKNKKPKTFKNVPGPVADLLEKHEGNISSFGRALGSTYGTAAAMLEGKTVFDDKRQRKVFEALHSVPSGQDDEDGPDQFLLDMAIVQVPSKNYDRVADVVDLLNGRRLFRSNTPSGWLVIYRIKGEEGLRKFKRIAGRDCSKVTCP